MDKETRSLVGFTLIKKIPAEFAIGKTVQKFYIWSNTQSVTIFTDGTAMLLEMEYEGPISEVTPDPIYRVDLWEVKPRFLGEKV